MERLCCAKFCLDNYQVAGNNGWRYVPPDLVQMIMFQYYKNHHLKRRDMLDVFIEYRDKRPLRTDEETRARLPNPYWRSIPFVPEISYPQGYTDLLRVYEGYHTNLFYYPDDGYEPYDIHDLKNRYLSNDDIDKGGIEKGLTFTSNRGPGNDRRSSQITFSVEWSKTLKDWWWIITVPWVGVLGPCGSTNCCVGSMSRPTWCLGDDRPDTIHHLIGERVMMRYKTKAQSLSDPRCFTKEVKVYLQIDNKRVYVESDFNDYYEAPRRFKNLIVSNKMPDIKMLRILK